MITAEVYITLKKTVSDPQGLTIRHALGSLGYNVVSDARMGKLVILKLNTESPTKAEKMVKEMCGKLLANPIIEEYTFKLK